MHYFYKIKSDSDYYKEFKKSKESQPKFKEVHKSMWEVMGLKPTPRVSINTENFWYDLDYLEDEEIKQLFSKDGYLKKNNKKANAYRKKYLAIIEQNGLKYFRSLFDLDFEYGFMRSANEQKMETFRGLDTVYVQTDFDLMDSKTEDMGYLERISVVEFTEAHLAAVKADAQKSA